MMTRRFARALLLLALHPCLPVRAADIDARVVGVVDGDTVTVIDAAQTRRTFRIAGIDAPDRTQPFGDRAQQQLAALVSGMQVRIETRPGTVGAEARAKIWAAPSNGSCKGESCPKTLDVGFAMLSLGMAWSSGNRTADTTPEERAQYEQAEFQAKIRRVGLWASKNPRPPWESRP